MPDITAQTLLQGFASLGVRPGMALEVHCAMGALGHVHGGADTVIDALMQAVGPEGALVMPSFCLAANTPLTEEDRQMGLTAKIRILAPDARRTAMGIVADTFRARKDVVTGKGVFRVSAWGKNAAQYAAHGLQPLIDGDGYALMIGTDIYSLSAMHYVEDLLPQDIKDRFAPSPEARERYPESRWILEAWNPPTRPWYKIQSAARAMNLITERKIGGAACMFFPVGQVVGLYKRALEKYPYSLYDM